MSDYAEIEPDCVENVKGDWGADDHVQGLATEEHNPSSSTRRDWCLRNIRTLSCLLLKAASFIFFSMRDIVQSAMGNLTQSYYDNVTDPLLSDSQTGNSYDYADEYARAFQTKMMCIESMKLPRVLIEHYRKVHDPNILALVDSSVQQICQHRESARILNTCMDSDLSQILQTSGKLKRRLEQCDSIIELNMTQLVDALSKTKKSDTLVEMVDSTAQSGAESQSVQALIDLNKSMLSASHAEPAIIHMDSTQHQQSTWIPSLSEQDIDRHRQAIEKMSRSQPSTSLLEVS